jgi:sugar lactone lactonase YvrE
MVCAVNRWSPVSPNRFVPRTGALALLAGVVATAIACGTSSSVGPTPTGSLKVTITGSTSSATSVTIQGPHSYHKVLTVTTTLADVATGAYTIATDTTQIVPDSIVGFGAVVGAVNGAGIEGTVTVTANDTARATVTFGMHRFGGLVIDGSDSNEVVEIAPANLTASGTVTPASDIDSTIILPAASALDAHGNLWVVSYLGNQIAMFTPAQRASASGKVAPAVVINGLEHPWGIAVDGSGTVWVANQSTNTLLGYTADQVTVSGSPTPAIVLSDTTQADRYLASPSGLLFDGSGNLWVANNGLGNGGMVDEFPRAELAASGPLTAAVMDSNQLIQPSRLAFDPAGNLWVSGYNSPGYLVEYAQSQLSTSEASPAVVLSMSAVDTSAHMWGVAFDKRGYLWTVSTRKLAAYAFAPAQLTTSGAPTPTTALTINSPARGTGSLGLTFDPYVLLPGN